MPYVLGTTFHAYTATASSTHPNHAVEALTDPLGAYHRPYYVWASGLVAGDQWVKADMGSVQSVGGVFLNNLNVTQIVLERSNDNSVWTSIGTLAVGIDVRVNRRRIYVPTTGLSFRYLRATFQEAQLDLGWGTVAWGAGSALAGTGGAGSGFFLGALALIDAIPLNYGPERPSSYERDEPTETVDFKSGNFEVHGRGRPYLVHRFSMSRIKAASDGATEWAAWDNLAEDSLCVFAEPFGNSAQAGIFRRVGPDAVGEDFYMARRGDVVLREQV